MKEDAAGNTAPVADRDYTVRFFLLLLVIFAAGGAILFAVFFVIFTRPLPASYSGIHFALRNLAAFLVPIMAFSMLAYALLMSLAVALLCVLASHKIAGPFYRMERALENYESGEPVKAVFLREGDQLLALAQAYNMYVARLREDRQKWLAAMEHAERLCMHDPATCRTGMEGALEKISSLLSKYR